MKHVNNFFSINKILMIGFLLIHFIFSINWDYSKNKNKSSSQPSSSVPKEFKEYCGAEYKFFGKAFNHHLEKLIVIFRHGDRVPVKNWNEEWDKKKCMACEFTDNTIKNCKNKNCEIGDLTTNGFSQAEALGKFISNNYIKLLFPEGVDKNAISCRVTKIGRTHSTLMGVLKNISKTDTIKNIKEIPDRDPLLKIKDCDYLEKQMLTDTKVSEATEELFEKLDIYDGKDLTYMADEIRCAMCNKVKVDKENIDNVFNTILNMTSNTWTKQMNNVNRDFNSKKIIFGRFAEDLVGELESKSSLSLISAHDGSIAMILAALTSKIQKWPPYTSAIFIEVWCKSSKKFVRLSYNNEKIDFDEYDEEFIPMEDFIEYILSLSIDDNEADQLCKGRNTGQRVNRSNLLTKNNLKSNRYYFSAF